MGNFTKDSNPSSGLKEEGVRSQCYFTPLLHLAKLIGIKRNRSSAPYHTCGLDGDPALWVHPLYPMYTASELLYRQSRYSMIIIKVKKTTKFLSSELSIKNRRNLLYRWGGASCLGGRGMMWGR